MALVAAAVDKAKELLSPEPVEIPQPIVERLKRGRDAMREGAPKRNECLAFARGDQYRWVDGKNVLQSQNTTTTIDGRGKPRHRIRQVRNLIFNIIEMEIASSVQKVPGYEVSPSSGEPRRETAAALAQKVALYGYDKWNLRHVTEHVCRLALIADEGFAWPYFDNTVGPYLPEDENGKRVGQGEIKVRVFSGNEVFWEPGVPFDDSRWIGIEQARDIPSVMEMEGYLGGKLTADGQKAETDKLNPQQKLVLVTDYLERPSPKNPEGRWITMANDRVIVGERPYPCLDGEGNVCDEPVLHKLTYSMDPENDRDSGLVRHLLDAQRTVNYCVAGETSVQTKDGPRDARSLAGETVETLTRDGRYRPAKWASYGTQPLWRVEFSDGQEIFATKEHGWIVRGKTKDERVVTEDLLGRRVPVVAREPSAPADRDEWIAGVRNGLVYGDGTTATRHLADGTPVRYSRMSQYNDNCELIERFFPGEHGERREVGGRTMLTTYGLPPELKAIPDPTRPVDYLRGFLAGLIAADGSVNSGGAVLVNSSKREDLLQVGEIARAAGVPTTSLRRTRGGTAYKEDAELFALGLNKGAFVNGAVDENLLLRPFHQMRMHGSLKDRGVRMTTRKVVAVEPTERVEEVFCCEEPKTESWVISGGIVTSNCNNKISEWAALAQNPQLLIVNGFLKQKLTDEAGAVYNVAGTGEMQWRPTPNTPQELFQLKEEASGEMNTIAGQLNLPSAGTSAKAFAAMIERETTRRANFIENLAQFHSRLMRHCLYLVQRHYTEPRLLMVRGPRGIQPIKDFYGAELLGEVDVRVAAGSLETLTHQAIEAKIMAFAERGWISPHAAMAAINAGTAENLIDSYERDVARANLIIQKVLEGPEVLFSTPPRRPFFGEDPGLDPETGLPREFVSGWMPRPFDDVKVQKDVFADWMKGTEYDDLDPPSQEAANQYYDALLEIEAKQQAQAAQAQALTAESLGMSNAAKPGGPPPLPDQAGLEGPTDPID
jgi:hypothetical protein